MLGPAEVRLNHSATPIKAYILNISYGGIAIQSTEALKGRVHVTILFANIVGHRMGETVAGRVVWCQPYDTMYRAGIELEELNHEEHSLTMQILHDFTGPPALQIA